MGDLIGRVSEFYCDQFGRQGDGRMIDYRDTRSAVLDASRRLLSDLYTVGDREGTVDSVERIHHLLSRPGVTNGRDPERLALVLVEGLAVLAGAVVRHQPPAKESRPRAKGK